MSANPDEHLRKPGSSGVEPRSPGKASEPAEPGQPTRPIAYVKPMVMEAPAPQRPERRHTRRRRESRSHPLGGRQRTERRQRRSHRQQEGFQEPSEASEGHGVQMVQVDHHPEELDVDTGVGAELPPGFPFTAITPVPVGSIQELPLSSDYWSFWGHQVDTLYPCIVFSPLSGTSLHFMQTSFGIHVFGVPEFLTHIGM